MVRYWMGANVARLSRLFGTSIVVLFLLSGCGGSSNNQATVTPGTPNAAIKHIVFCIKENRTFDNYFGTYPGANGATTATDSAGQTVSLHHQADQIPDIDHSSQGARTAWDNGKMDKFDLLHSNRKKAAPAAPAPSLKLSENIFPKRQSVV